MKINKIKKIFLYLLIIILFGLIVYLLKNKPNIKQPLTLNLSDKIGMVYYINLDKREDRKKEVIEEINKLELNENQIERVPGVLKEGFGELGCALSHIECLKKFINSNKENCIIFEDDFMFTHENTYIKEQLNNFFNLKIKYDICMLSSNTFKDEDTQYGIIKKVLDARTTSGYIVHKNFAQKLLDNYIEGAKKLEETKTKNLYVIDMFWIDLQAISNWYVFNPVLGKQRPSFSDILNEHTDYPV
jgi:glycosyl transferase family 25